MGDDILRNTVRLSSADRSRPLHVQPLDPYAHTQASPASVAPSNKRRHHRLPSKTLQASSSESLRPEPLLASQQSLHVHDHHSKNFQHDGRDRRSESLAPPEVAVSPQKGFPHHLSAQPYEKPRDPEKAEGVNWLEETHTCGGSFSTPHTTIHYPSENCDDGSEPEDHSVWILIYLSSLSPFLALLFALYTALTTAILLLLLPFGFFCTERKPLRDQLHFFLSPPLGFQLGLVYSDVRVPATAGDDGLMLILINVCSPIYSIWISTSAWVAAFFWAFTTVMGDTDGKDGKDDGREAVMGVRRWWESWLKRGLR